MWRWRGKSYHRAKIKERKTKQKCRIKTEFHEMWWGVELCHRQFYHHPCLIPFHIHSQCVFHLSDLYKLCCTIPFSNVNNIAHIHKEEHQIYGKQWIIFLLVSDTQSYQWYCDVHFKNNNVIVFCSQVKAIKNWDLKIN